MVIDSIFAATRFGLEFERMRLEAASHNIAVADTPVQPGVPARLMQVSVAGHFGQTLGVSDAGTHAAPLMVSTDAPTRTEHDPGDPSADKQGMVSYPRVDMVSEMRTLIDADLAKEANVRAFNVIRSMALQALDLGGGA